MYYCNSTLVYMNDNKKFKDELVDLLTKIKDKKLMFDFLEDIFTPQEFKEIGRRLQIVKQLAQKTPHRLISKKLGIGVATVTRGSRELNNKNGGFAKIIKKYYAKQSN